MHPPGQSPSSRRAWIEIPHCDGETADGNVALLAEGVDRNTKRQRERLAFLQSPSSRRAWIEMVIILGIRTLKTVALLAEGVDRNMSWDDNTFIQT